MSVEYATADEIQKHFAVAMNDLFCLAFLLIANGEKAEDCLIQSIRECFNTDAFSWKGFQLGSGIPSSGME